MEITLLGGTGDIGEGLALRWARDTDHSVIVGSRDPDKAERKADEYYSRLKDAGHAPDVAGDGNATSTVDAVADALGEDDVLVSPARVRHEHGRRRRRRARRG